MNFLQVLSRWEFGDYQTPDALAEAVCQRLADDGIAPGTIIEPTCGKGAFLSAALGRFPSSTNLFGVEINASYVDAARRRIAAAPVPTRIEQADIFELDWAKFDRVGTGPWLFLGNPPWVTTADLGRLNSGNRPDRTSSYAPTGFAALTGKSNFDVSEWLLLRQLDWLRDRRGWVAMLVKTAVARKVLARLWREHYPLASAKLFGIDAGKHFDAAVEACLLVVEACPDGSADDCAVFENLDSAAPARHIAWRDGLLVSDNGDYDRYRGLLGPERRRVWRSGIKHDCAKIMELRPHADGYANGLGEHLDLEPTRLFPLMKGSDVAAGRSRGLAMLVPQDRVGGSTAPLADLAPRTWAYLVSHADRFERRGSRIYKDKPPFSIFGVGDYSFASWKVAISGMGASLAFRCVGPIDGRPVVFDDTVYFLPCEGEEEAQLLTSILNAEPAQRFIGSMMFRSDKRPVTVELLKQIDLGRLADEVGVGGRYRALTPEAKRPVREKMFELPLILKPRPSAVRPLGVGK